MNMSTYFRGLTILHIALFAAQAVFAAVLVFLHPDGQLNLNPENDIFFLICPAVAVGALIGGNLFYKKQLEQIVKLTSVTEKMARYRTLQIIRFAMMEAPTLFSLVAYFLTANLYYMVIAALMLLIFITLKPSRTKAESELNERFPE